MSPDLAAELTFGKLLSILLTENCQSKKPLFFCKYKSICSIKIDHHNKINYAKH